MYFAELIVCDQQTFSLLHENEKKKEGENGIKINIFLSSRLILHGYPCLILKFALQLYYALILCSSKELLGVSIRPNERINNEALWTIIVLGALNLMN